MPRVSVLLPVYNGMPFLPAAIESVLTQTYSDLELVVVDDGSLDGSADYAASLNDPRVRLVRKNNTGLGDTLNVGLNYCESELVARMDSDDISLPHRLELQVRYLELHPECVMAGTQIEFLVEGVRQRASRAPTDHSSIERMLLSGRAGVCHPTIIFRTDVARSLGGYRLQGAGEDIDFCLRMCDQGRVANISPISYQYRLHPGSVSLGSQDHIRIGYSYAVACAKCRKAHQPEPAMSEFSKQWLQRSAVEKWAGDLDAWSLLQYRIGRIDLAHGCRMRGAVRLAAAAACRPRSALRLFMALAGELGRNSRE